MNKNSVEYFQSQTKYLVEGDPFWVWKERSTDSLIKETGVKKYNWVQKNPGSLVTIEKVELNGVKYPVCVSLCWYCIEGVYVCFYEATSRVVDHDIIDKFLEKEFPGVSKTNLMNFGHALNYIEELNK